MNICEGTRVSERRSWRYRLLRPMAVLAAGAIAVGGLLALPSATPEAVAGGVVNAPGGQTWYQGTETNTRLGNYTNKQGLYAYCALRDNRNGPSPAGNYYGAAVDITNTGYTGIVMDPSPREVRVAGGATSMEVAYLLSRFGRTSDLGESAAVKIAMYMLEGVWSPRHVMFNTTSVDQRNRANYMFNEARQWGTHPLDIPKPVITGAAEAWSDGQITNIGIQSKDTHQWWGGNIPLHVRIVSNNAVFADGSQLTTVRALNRAVSLPIRRTVSGKEIELQVYTDVSVPLSRLYKMTGPATLQELFWAPQQRLDSTIGVTNTKPDVPQQPSLWTQADHRVKNGEPMRDTVTVTGPTKQSWNGARFVFDVYGPFSANEVPVATREHLFKRVVARDVFKGPGAYPSEDVVPTKDGYYYWLARLVKGGEQCFAGLAQKPTGNAGGAVAPKPVEVGSLAVRVESSEAGKPVLGKPLQVMGHVEGVLPEKSVVSGGVTSPKGVTAFEPVVISPKGDFKIAQYTPSTVGDHRVNVKVTSPDGTVLARTSYDFDVTQPDTTNNADFTIQAGLNVLHGEDSETVAKPFAQVNGIGDTEGVFVRFTAVSDTGKTLDTEDVSVTAWPSVVPGKGFKISEAGKWTVKAALMSRGEANGEGEYPNPVVLAAAQDWWGMHFTITAPKQEKAPEPEPATPSKPSEPGDPNSPSGFPPAGCGVLWEGKLGDQGENTWVYSVNDLKVRTEAQHLKGVGSLGQLRDKLIISGNVPEGAYAKVSLFYQKTAGETKTCTAPVWVSDKVVLKPGMSEAYTEYYTVSKPGVYHFQETVYDRDGNVLVQGQCGVAEETVVVENVPQDSSGNDSGRGLAQTGSTAQQTAVAASLLLAAGLLLTVVARRRKLGGIFG